MVLTIFKIGIFFYCLRLKSNYQKKVRLNRLKGNFSTLVGVFNNKHNKSSLLKLACEYSSASFYLKNETTFYF